MRRIKGMGWERDLPDFADFTVQSPDVKGVRSKLKRLPDRKTAPSSVGFTKWSPPSKIKETWAPARRTRCGATGVFPAAGLWQAPQWFAPVLVQGDAPSAGVDGRPGAAYLRTTMKASGPLRPAAGELLVL